MTAPPKAFSSGCADSALLDWPLHRRTRRLRTSHHLHQPQHHHHNHQHNFFARTARLVAGLRAAVWITSFASACFVFGDIVQATIHTPLPSLSTTLPTFFAASFTLSTRFPFVSRRGITLRRTRFLEPEFLAQIALESMNEASHSPLLDLVPFTSCRSPI